VFKLRFKSQSRLGFASHWLTHNPFDPSRFDDPWLVTHLSALRYLRCWVIQRVMQGENCEKLTGAVASEARSAESGDVFFNFGRRGRQPPPYQRCRLSHWGLGQRRGHWKVFWAAVRLKFLIAINLASKKLILVNLTINRKVKTRQYVSIIIQSTVHITQKSQPNTRMQSQMLAFRLLSLQAQRVI